MSIYKTNYIKATWYLIKDNMNCRYFFNYIEEIKLTKSTTADLKNIPVTFNNHFTNYKHIKKSKINTQDNRHNRNMNIATQHLYNPCYNHRH